MRTKIEMLSSNREGDPVCAVERRSKTASNNPKNMLGWVHFYSGEEKEKKGGKIKKGGGKGRPRIPKRILKLSIQSLISCVLMGIVAVSRDRTVVRPA
jgi:hypothetical protein